MCKLDTMFKLSCARQLNSRATRQTGSVCGSFFCLVKNRLVYLTLELKSTTGRGFDNALKIGLEADLREAARLWIPRRAAFLLPA